MAPSAPLLQDEVVEVSDQSHHVREATTADAAGIAAIYNEAIAERVATFETEPQAPEDFFAWIEDEGRPLLVAESGGSIVGWAGLAPYSGRSWYAGIGEFSVYVGAGARRHGIGAVLVEALADDAERRGYHKMIGKLFTDNAPSIGLVERCGFSPVGLHRRHGELDGRWRDVLLVERVLAPTLSR
jgi:phosphinothricin acetyltransferase